MSETCATCVLWCEYYIAYYYFLSHEIAYDRFIFIVSFFYKFFAVTPWNKDAWPNYPNKSGAKVLKAMNLLL